LNARGIENTGLCSGKQIECGLLHGLDDAFDGVVFDAVSRIDHQHSLVGEGKYVGRGDFRESSFGSTGI